MIKLDVHTVSAHQGRFVRLAVSVYLRKPLVSKLQINGSVYDILAGSYKKFIQKFYRG
ncbi:hypothetical protein Golax_025537 [Gossypium laxum]|uniref:Uncharacterized protein n=1 Tax=Gossypium laxum TaxID=34288 RepID=A0A7J9B202_9ROSI|nr:hypothetical protein [Gossypium laxum]